MASEDTVQQFLDFTNYQLGKDDAAQLLKICDNNLEAAVSKFYDTDPGNLRSLLNNAPARWDETAFGSGRYGQDDPGGSMPTFNIDYAPGYENYPHSNVQSRAPTRPPSRTSQRSALSTHFGDAPMQSIEHMQESGVIGNSSAVFGPATKEHYDTEQWAMVPASTEIIPDPIPSERQREEGHPGILKPSPRFNYLPALIPILHSIPIFRNALLASPNITQRSYWMGDDWWQGNPAIPARVIDRDAGLQDADWLEIINETQRLMAFLDRSDRAYATVTSMFELDSWKRFKPTTLEDEDDDLVKFLLLWSAAYQAMVPEAQLNGRLRSLVNIGNGHVDNFVFDATVVREGARSNLNLYDVLDDNLFSSAGGSAHITDISKVLILRLTSATTNAQGLGCRVPATLYADRYMELNKPVIDGMYRDMKTHEDQLQDIKNTAQRLKYHTPKKEKSKPVETLRLLQSSMKAFESQAGEDESDSKDATVLSQLQTLYQNIESKLAVLDAHTKEITETLGGISNRFKPIVDDSAETLIDVTETDYPEGQSPQDAMHHPYKLCGVATHFGVVYLLHPDTKSNVPGAQQWWRVQYDTETSTPPIRHDRLTQEEVIERAATESSAALLVYAHADAMAEEMAPLSKALEDFVKKDGLNFMEELQKSATAWEDVGYDANGDEPGGNWADPNNPPDYDQEWASMSAKQFHQHNRNASSYSSATLTPNTEHDEMGAGVTEMVEVNGGMDALTGMSSGASSSTIEGDRMDMDIEGATQRHGPATVMERRDEVMADAEPEEPRVQHIEIAEKKGG